MRSPRRRLDWVWGPRPLSDSLPRRTGTYRRPGVAATRCERADWVHGEVAPDLLFGSSSGSRRCNSGALRSRTPAARQIGPGDVRKADLGRADGAWWVESGGSKLHRVAPGSAPRCNLANYLSNRGLRRRGRHSGGKLARSRKAVQLRCSLSALWPPRSVRSARSSALML